MSSDKPKGFLRNLFGSRPEATDGEAPDAQTSDRADIVAAAEAEAEAEAEDVPGNPAEAQAEAGAEEIAAEEEDPKAPVTPGEGTPSGWLGRLQSGLSKTSRNISSGIAGVFTKAKLDDDAIEDLEDILIQADLGIETASKITDKIAASRFDRNLTPEDIGAILSREVADVLKPVARPLKIDTKSKPQIIMMVGVNGSGKTTTIGKLAAQYRNQGKSVMLVAGDTFRAAAVDQLKIWGERTGATVFSRDIGADSSGLAFDAIKKAKGSNTDILLIDTAGRLQNKATLMAELEKIIRVIHKVDDTAPHNVVLVLDATTGQNALNQVEVFREKTGVTGLIMTKLDGTARGGILVAIAGKYGLPIHAIGIGENIDDLQPFDPDEFADAIARTG